MASPQTFSPKSMTYILQVTRKLGATRAERLETIHRTNRDMMVIDYAEHGDRQSKWTKKEIAGLQSGGSYVICYLSIGEAENYRFYWEKQWKKCPPPFICKENTHWKGNFAVEFWRDEWHAIVLTYLDEIVSQGFDGVYLDIVDAYQFFEFDNEKGDWIDNRVNPATGQTYRQDMIDFVRAISEYAKSRKDSFIIIPQNGTELLSDASYLTAIDAVAVEDLFTNGNKVQPRSHTEAVLEHLQPLQKGAKPVLLIEYPTKNKFKQLAAKKANVHGMPLLITDRHLKTIGDIP